MSRQARHERRQRKILNVIAQAEAQGQLRPGNYYEIPVRHERHCQLFQGGSCTCEPEVRLPERVPSPQEN
jgi:hypothetical protein